MGEMSPVDVVRLVHALESLARPTDSKSIAQFAGKREHEIRVALFEARARGLIVWHYAPKNAFGHRDSYRTTFRGRAVAAQEMSPA
jgi:hypothetical protein